MNLHYSYLQSLQIRFAGFSTEIDRFKKAVNDLVSFCDGVDDDYSKDLCFSEISPKLPDQEYIIDGLAKQRQAAEKIAGVIQQQLDYIKISGDTSIARAVADSTVQLINCLREPESEEN
jgi:hypothetical protein